jgi:hypothetical protein
VFQRRPKDESVQAVPNQRRQTVHTGAIARLGLGEQSNVFIFRGHAYPHPSIRPAARTARRAQKLSPTLASKVPCLHSNSL